MAVGVPVVTTSAGLEGIVAEPGKQVLVADDDVGFAEMVVGVLADPGVRQRVGEASRQLVESDYRWDDRLTRYSQLVTQVVQAQERP